MDSICDFDFIAFDNPWICIDFIVSIFSKKCKAMGCQNEDSHIFFSLIAGVCFDKLFPLFGNLLAETQYKGYVDYISSQGKGSSIIRLAIAMIPCVIAYMARYAIEDENNKLINFSINMSVIIFAYILLQHFQVEW